MISSKRGNSPCKGPELGRNIIRSRNPKQFFVAGGMRVMANVSQDKARGEAGAHHGSRRGPGKGFTMGYFLKSSGRLLIVGF